MITFDDANESAFMDMADLASLQDYGEVIPQPTVGKIWRRREPVYGAADVVTYTLFAWRFTAGSSELVLRSWKIFLNSPRDQVRLIRGGVVKR